MDELCACPSADVCRCYNSYYRSLLPPHQPYQPFPPQVPQGANAPQGVWVGNPPQFMHYIPPQMAGNPSPMSSGYSSPSGHGYRAQNTIPFPLTDTTNTPTPTPTGHKRKRAAALSGNPRPPKRVESRASTSSNPPVSVGAAQSCGVGPSIPVPRTPGPPPGPPRRTSFTDEIPPPHTRAPPPITTVPPPTASSSTQQPDAGFTSKKRSDSANAATDVYFFVRALNSSVPPTELPGASAGEGELTDPGILTEKPSSEKFSHLGCRLCS